jgi:hypothetical protein
MGKVHGRVFPHGQHGVPPKAVEMRSELGLGGCLGGNRRSENQPPTA